MKWHESLLILFAMVAVVFVILSMEKCQVQQDCLSHWSSDVGPPRLAKDCGL